MDPPVPDLSDLSDLPVTPAGRAEVVLDDAMHAAEAYRILSEAGGPLGADELADRLVAEGRAPLDAASAVEAMIDHDGVHLLSDGRVVDVWVALDGARVAHRLTADELIDGVLAPGADLIALADLFDPDEGELFLGDGIHLQEVDPAFDADLLMLYSIPTESVPPGGAWLLVGADLGAAAPGDVIVIAIDDREARLIGPLSEDTAPIGPFDDTTAGAVADALLAAWRDAAQVDLEEPDPDLEPGPDQMPAPLDEIVFDAVVREPRVLGPGSPPFGEVLERAGWVTNGEVVGAAGTDLSMWELTMEVAELAAFYRLDEERAVALAHLLALFDQVTVAVEGDDALDGPDNDDQRAVPAPDRSIDLGDDAGVTLSWLVDPDVASAFVSQAIGIRVDHAVALFQFAVNARDRAPKNAAPATLWLEAKALNRLGHALPAAERLDEAVRLDREFVPLLLDAANLASDRGDAATAIRFARAAGLNDTDDFVRTLADMVPAAPPGLGRNEPCFCGSGRKYKQCHLGRVDLDLDQRAGWLYRKALEWIQDTPWRLRLLEIAAAYSPDEEDDDVVLHLAMSEPFIADLALSDDGAWREFVLERGVLLPDDERELAERWATIERSVFEVTAVHPGTGVEVRDLRGGPDTPVVSVAERTFSAHATVGDLILARILPADTTEQFFGGIIALDPDEHEDVAAVLDASASGTEIAGLLGSMRGGPRLTNTEGEPLVFCGATYSLPAAAIARAALDDDPDLRPDRTRPTDGDAEGIEPFDAAWVEEVTIDGRDWIRARYTLRGDELVLEANSEVRITRAQERVVTSIPGAELTHEEQRPLDELADTAPFDPRALLGTQPEVTPELQAVMDEFTRSAEIQWLDTPVPVLGDVTPRQAAAPDHPQHRTLLGLLDDLARPAPAGTVAVAIDPDRLRRDLGLA